MQLCIVLWFVLRDAAPGCCPTPFSPAVAPQHGGGVSGFALYFEHAASRLQADTCAAHVDGAAAARLHSDAQSLWAGKPKATKGKTARTRFTLNPKP